MRRKRGRSSTKEFNGKISEKRSADHEPASGGFKDTGKWYPQSVRASTKKTIVCQWEELDVGLPNGQGIHHHRIISFGRRHLMGWVWKH